MPKFETNQPIVLSIDMSQGAAHVDQALDQGIVRDGCIGPDGADQLLLGHQSAAVLDQG